MLRLEVRDPSLIHGASGLRVAVSRLSRIQVIVLENKLAPLQAWWRYKAKMHAIVRIQRLLRAVQAGVLDRRAVALILAHQGRAVFVRPRAGLLAQEEAERPSDAPESPVSA
jgi:hypothetical protein